MLDFALSQNEKDLYEEIYTFAKAELNDNIEERYRTQRFDRALWQKCGLKKIPGLLIPKKYGGRGLTAIDTVIAMQAMGQDVETAD